ncbi:hypothetical protein DFH09DRAFT_1357911 [Mycena vulgaris]|nr:hypothetical protein DFH09DRAFT_1357911 [Mycena vulgaris]
MTRTMAASHCVDARSARSAHSPGNPARKHGARARASALHGFWCPLYWPAPVMAHMQPVAGWVVLRVMPFMIAFATKLNVVALLTGTSHGKLQVFRQWSAVLMYIVSLVHTFPFIVQGIAAGPMRVEWRRRGSTGREWRRWCHRCTYLIALPWGIFRNPYYEVFKKIHFMHVPSLAPRAGLTLHAAHRASSWPLSSSTSTSSSLPSPSSPPQVNPYTNTTPRRDYFRATAALYFSARLLRVLRTLYTTRICPYRAERAYVRGPVPVEHGRVAWAPGQHVFVRFAGLGVRGALTSHPFTIVSVRADGAAEMALRVHGGVTRALVERMNTHARAHGDAAWAARVAVNGPHGVHVDPAAHERMYLCCAGGSGATFTLPLLPDLAARLEVGGAACRCTPVEFVGAVRDHGASPSSPSTSVSALGAAKLSGSNDGKGSATGSDVDGRPELAQLVHAAAHAGAAHVAIYAALRPSWTTCATPSACELAIVDGFGGACMELFHHSYYSSPSIGGSW